MQRGREEEKHIAKHIDFELMTGYRAEAPRTVEEMQQEPNSLTRSRVYNPKRLRMVSSEYEDEPKSGIWNSSNKTQLPLALNPCIKRSEYSLPTLIGKDDLDALNEPAKSVPSRRSHHPKEAGANVSGLQDNLPDRPSKRMKTKQWPQVKRQREASTDSDTPLVPKATQGPRHLTPSFTKTPSELSFPVRPGIGDLGSDDNYCHVVKQNESTADMASLTRMQSAHCPRNVINKEPLSAYARSRTTLLVKASNMQDRAAVCVPMELCRTSRELFSRLTAERQLDSRVAEKVRCIDATHTWGVGRSYGIRKGSEQDWERFIKALRLAWETKDFQDECEVEMLLHVD